jgi:F0F1-type ATP synthase epsilon subunit
MPAFQFSIQTPGGTVVSGAVTPVEVRPNVGSLGVLARHQPMVAACPAGVVRIQQDGAWVRFKTEAAILTTDGEKATLLTPFAQFAGTQMAESGLD